MSLAAGATLPRLLAGADPAGGEPTLAAHLRAYGPMPSLAPEQLIEQVTRSGLRGRGGADFPTGRKLATVAARRGVSALVVNGSETEPASDKDGVLMTAVPHLVLDGALAAATAVGALEVIVTLGPRNRAAGRVLQRAIAERSDPLPVQLVAGPAGYVGGEESAVIHRLNGGAGKPTFVPPRPFDRGYRHRPTLVQNAETLAHVALIARFGAEWFGELGTAADPGTVLSTISGAVAAPGVYELAFGTPLRDLLGAAGGATEPIQALLVGGYFGTWIPWRATDGLTLARAELAAGGHALGAGVLVALGESACALHESAALANYLAGESSGQCGPCVHGLRAMADAFAALVQGRGAPEERARLQRWAAELPGRGACHHPDGTARLIRSALETFGDELDRHAAGECTAAPAGLPGVPELPAPAPPPTEAEVDWWA
jgi:NADH:ubiquinone oxidoreductase subunit F (NADH-binding)